VPKNGADAAENRDHQLTTKKTKQNGNSQAYGSFGKIFRHGGDAR
jgi:hypothetical protein